jgi:T-complex protein 1 subunit beta
MENYLKPGGYEQKGEEARMNALFGAYSLCDMVKTTLGPKGMDKILKPYNAGPKDSKIIVTNDGATILSHLHIDNSAAKVLVDISKTQDEDVGDGTTSVCVLAGELLREAEKLLAQRIHPQVIIDGWRKARDVALDVLRQKSRDNSGTEKFQEDLMNIARTTISSKLLTYEKEHFAKLAVDAVLRLRGSPNLELIQIIKRLGGSLKDSYLDEGFILEKSISIGCPTRKEKPRILLANTPMDYDKIKIFGTRVKVDSMDKVAEIEAAEKDKMRQKVDRMLAYKPDIFINRQLVYNYPEQLFSEKGVMVIEHADFEGIERLAKSLGAEILSTFDAPEKAEQVLGRCDLVEEMMLGEDKVIKFSGCKLGEACSVVLRGSSSHLLDEAERSLHDALCVLVKTLENKKTIYGGGNGEICMAIAVEDLARTVKGKQAIAIEAYSRALKRLPTIIAENGGYDATELVQNISFAIRNGNESAGLNMNEGKVGCMKEMGITECLRVKEQVVVSATEAAEMILRVDKIVYCAPRQREKTGVHN